MSVPAIAPVASTGTSLPTAVRSVSNLRSLRRRVDSVPFVANDSISIRLGNLGYIKSNRVVIKVPFTVALGATAGAAATLRDVRKIVNRIAFALQGSTEPRSLDGISENVMNRLDYRVRDPRVRVVRRDTGAEQARGAALTNATYDITFELKPLYTISEQNLYSLLYVGGGSTSPTLEIGTSDVASFITFVNGATAAFGAGTVDVYMEWITAERPAPPSADGDPGSGLWDEVSVVKQTKVVDNLPVSGAGQELRRRLDLGPVYGRIVIIAFEGNEVDDDDTLLRELALTIQMATTTVQETLDSLDMLFEETYMKTRPKGVYVFPFVDKSSMGRELLYSSALGQLELILTASAAAPPANSSFRIITERLVSVNSSGVLVG